MSDAGAAEEPLRHLSVAMDLLVRSIHLTIPGERVREPRLRSGIGDGVPLGLLLELRLPLLAGPVDAGVARRLFRFLDPSAAEQLISAPIDAGLCRIEGSSLRLTDQGRSLLIELRAAYAGWLEPRWEGSSVDVDALAGLQVHLATAGSDPAGVYPAWRAVLAAGDRSLTPLPWNVGTAFRYLRADAHALAWRAAGVALGSELADRSRRERELIEAETDRRLAAWLPRLDRQLATSLADHVASLTAALGAGQAQSAGG